MGSERRQRPRYEANLDVLVHAGGGAGPIRGASSDISRSGVFVRVRERVPHGRRVGLVINTGLPGGPIIANGVVVHTVSGVGIGVRFSHISPQALGLIEDLLSRIRTYSGAHAV